MNTAEYEKILKSKCAAPIAAVTMRTGGTAYVRQPTPDEYASLQASEDAKRAFVEYVRCCFLGALSANGEELTYAEVQALEGPAFVAGGGLGHAVNKLAGAGESAVRFL